MLVSYFLKRFCISFALYFSILTFLFAVINIFLRLHLIHSLSIIPLLAWSMLPLVTTFAFPFAATMAVCSQINNLRQNQECLFIRTSTKAHRSALLAVGLFSFFTVLVYMPVVFFWAPYSYRQGKTMLANIAYQKISELSSNKLHTPFPGAALYFKNKKLNENKLAIFEHLFFSYADKDKKQHIFIAQYGFKEHNTFVLKDGAMVIGAFGQSNFLQFNSCTLFLDQLIKKQAPIYSQTKFLSIYQLFKNRWHNSKALLDFHKRIAQQLWLFLLPFFAFYFFFFITPHASSIVWGILFSGLSFFIMYLSFMIANLTWTYAGISIIIFYLVPMLCLIGVQQASAHKR